MVAALVVSGPQQCVPTSQVPMATHPVAVYLARLSVGSRRTIRPALVVVAEIASGGVADALQMNWAALRYQHTQAIRARLAAIYSPATANHHLAALRGVLKEAWRLGLMGAEDYHRAVDMAPVRGETLPRGRALSDGEVRALFGALTSGGPGDARDAALLAILYGCGLRRAEAVALDLTDYDKTTGALTVRHGKGNKARVCYAPSGARVAIETWLQARGDSPGPLLCAVNKGGRIELRPITGQAVLYVVRKRAEQAGIAQFSPHDCRRSFISSLLDAGADIATVQKLAGHSNVTTTARYDRRGEETKRKAVDLLHVPFVAR